MVTDFELANKVSLDVVKKVEDYLKGWGYPALIIAVNSMSLFLDLPDQYRQLNSTLCISQRGGGKSTLILHILAKSNPELFQPLPKKMFESQLIQQPESYFNGKVLIHDDIVVAFGGLSKKQRQQLVNFFTSLLSDGSYDRQDFEHLKNIRCLAHFGIAKESYVKYRRELLDSTFLDRFATYEVEITRDKKLAILKHRDLLKAQNIPLPCIPLPIPEKPIKVSLNLSEKLLGKRNDMAMELDDYNVMSFARAQNYIDLFLMSNALLNQRKTAEEHDLSLYEKLHRYHLSSCGELKIEDSVRKELLQNPTKSSRHLMEKLNIPKTTYYRIFNRLKARGEILEVPKSR